LEWWGFIQPHSPPQLTLIMATVWTECADETASVIDIPHRNRRSYDSGGLIRFNGLGSTTFAAPVTQLSTTTNGANRFREMMEDLYNNGVNMTRDIYSLPSETTLRNFWNRPTVYQSLMQVTSSILPSATQYCGIQMGQHLTTTPWNVVSTQTCVQLRVRMDTLAWELAVQTGDGVTPETIYPLTGVSAYILTRTYRLGLSYVPGQYLAAAVNDTEGVRITTGLPRSNPPNDIPAGRGVGIFVSSGSLVGSVIAAFSSIVAETTL